MNLEQCHACKRPLEDTAYLSQYGNHEWICAKCKLSEITDHNPLVSSLRPLELDERTIHEDFWYDPKDLKHPLKPIPPHMVGTQQRHILAVIFRWLTPPSKHENTEDNS